MVVLGGRAYMSVERMAMMSCAARSFTIVLGTGSGLTGYTNLSGGIGTIAPNDVLQGLTIDRLSSLNTAPAEDIDLNMSGSGTSQMLFNTMIIQDGSGAFRTYQAADATFDSATNRWRWGDGSNRVWLSTDSGETKRVTFIL